MKCSNSVKQHTLRILTHSYGILLNEIPVLIFKYLISIIRILYKYSKRHNSTNHSTCKNSPRIRDTSLCCSAQSSFYLFASPFVFRELYSNLSKVLNVVSNKYLRAGYAGIQVSVLRLKKRLVLSCRGNVILSTWHFVTSQRLQTNTYKSSKTNKISWTDFQQIFNEIIELFKWGVEQ